MVSDTAVRDGPWCVTYDSAKSSLYVTNGISNDVAVLSDAGDSAHTTSTGVFDWTWIIIIIVIVVVLIILVLLWLNRSRDLTVTVKDQQTMSPIEDAKVAAEYQKDSQKNLSGITKNNGQVVFTKVEKGDYTIIAASAAGYNPSVSVTVTVNKKTDVLVKLTSNQPKPVPMQTQQTSFTVPPPIQTQPTPTVEPQATAAIVINNEQEAPELQGWRGNKINQYIETFKIKGAITPETALSPDELGLSRLFVRSMEKRRGQTRYFVEVNGKYYLDQKALKETDAEGSG